MSRRDVHQKPRQAATRRRYADQPGSQDATRTTVHDRRKPSRAEPDARRRPPFAVLAFAAAAPAEDTGTAETTTMPRRQSPEAQDETQCFAQAWKRRTTRKPLHKTLCGDEEPLLRSEEEYPSAAQCQREETAARSKSSSVRGRRLGHA